MLARYLIHEQEDWKEKLKSATMDCLDDTRSRENAFRFFTSMKYDERLKCLLDADIYEENEGARSICSFMKVVGEFFELERAYEVLGISECSSIREIRQIYNSKTKELHWGTPPGSQEVTVEESRDFREFQLDIAMEAIKSSLTRKSA